MKISTIRSLLVLLDILILAGIAGVVWTGLKAKNGQPALDAAYKRTMNQRLEEARPVGVAAHRPPAYTELDRIAFSTRKAEPEAARVAAPKVAETPHDPLADLITMVGIEIRSGEEPSVMLYTRKGEEGTAGRGSAGAAKPRAPVVRPGVQRAPLPAGRTTSVTTAGGGMLEVYVAYEGEVIEFGKNHYVVVKSVLPDRVICLYDGKDVSLAVPTEREGATAGSGKGGAPGSGAGEAKGPINPDPGTWIAWTEAKPQAPVRITKNGMRAMRQSGDDVLKGVRWSSERLSDGKKAVRIDALPKDGVLARGGAREGDVVVSINGTRVSSRGDIVAYVKANPDLPKYVVIFKRDGRERRRTVMPPRRP